VRLIFLDVDGTLTDGIVGHTATGDFRHFWVRDGVALQWARDLGVISVAISGRRSPAVKGRMDDLKVEYHEGVRDKVAVAEKVLKREGARWEDCVMVGDDLPDVALMKRVGWPIAVANAQPEVNLVAKTVLGTFGGHGAVREMVEMVLRHNGTWDQVLRWFEA
jgi:3-deoxy-D-manno-octulosonate 8-phosphate phosphatase (KDO 8-P phosphatase)